MVRAWHGRGIASVNQTRPHCVNQMGKTHSKPLATRHGRGTAWARHAMCESAFMAYLFNVFLAWLSIIQNLCYCPTYFRYNHTFHVLHSLYFHTKTLVFYFVSCFLLRHILSSGIATSINKHVLSFMLLIITSGLLP
jgi:hypothetical protein